MGIFASKEKNDPQIENIYRMLKGDSENYSELTPDPNFRSEAQEWTMLHIAVWFSNKQIVEILMNHNFDVSDKDVVVHIQHGETPLHLAAYQNNRELYEMLKKGKNADLSIKNNVYPKQEGKTSEDLLNENKINN